MNKLIASPLFQTNWIVPRNIMCALFWTGVFVVFMGMILLVTSKHKGPAFLSWGSVVLGLGLCVLLVCLMLCIHAYCVVANASRTEDGSSYDAPMTFGNRLANAQGSNVQYTPNSSYDPILSQKNKNKSSTVRFNLVDRPDEHEDFRVAEKEEIVKDSIETTFAIEPCNENHTPKSHRRPTSTDRNNQFENCHGPPAVTSAVRRDCEDESQEYKRSFPDHSIEYNDRLNKMSTVDLLSENLPNVSITRNFGASTITVTPIQHNHYDYHLFHDVGRTRSRPRDSAERSRMHAIRHGHIVAGNRPEFNPIFPDTSEHLNETELGRFPLNEIADSKATVYDNVNYFHV